MTTAIEWTDETWNPTVGCSRISPGCDNCYAIDVAHRAMQPAHEGLTIRPPGERPDWTGEVRCLPDRLTTPLRWRRPRRVFVDSMSDLFHKAVPADFVAEVWATMAMTPQHTYQVLTKRPQRMGRVLAAIYADVELVLDLRGYRRPVEWVASEYPDSTSPRWLPNVWLGTSIENDRYTWRADHLRATPAAVRFLSLEPLLGPLPSLDLTGISWVIVGGESGAHARPMQPDWVRDIRDRCVDAGVPFFFKQWGAWAPEPTAVSHVVLPPRVAAAVHASTQASGRRTIRGDAVDAAPRVVRTVQLLKRVGKRAAGRELDGRTWDEMPERAGA